MLEYNRSIAVILPAYNEELTIAGTLRAFHAVMPDAFFYVVDNNSTDATAHIAEETLANLGAQGGLLHEARQGKGNAVRRAFFEIDADVYVLVDADMTYPAEALPQLVAPILAGEADMVYGDRLSEGDYARQNRRTFHGFGNSLVQGLVNAVSGTHFTDIMTGYLLSAGLLSKVTPCWWKVFSWKRISVCLQHRPGYVCLAFPFGMWTGRKAAIRN